MEEYKPKGYLSRAVDYLGELYTSCVAKVREEYNTVLTALDNLRNTSDGLDSKLALATNNGTVMTYEPRGAESLAVLCGHYPGCGRKRKKKPKKKKRRMGKRRFGHH
jgi:hypothetical protein